MREDLRTASRNYRSNACSGSTKLNVPRSSLPAVTHVDYSARIQTVHYDTNPRFIA